MMAGIWGWPAGPSFPLGLGGIYGGTMPDEPKTTEEKVKDAQDSVVNVTDGRSELWLQACYQYLYALGHRMHGGDPHLTLLKLAKRT